MIESAGTAIPVMARLIRSTYCGTVLEQVARTSPAMAVSRTPPHEAVVPGRRLSINPGLNTQAPGASR